MRRGLVVLFVLWLGCHTITSSQNAEPSRPPIKKVPLPEPTPPAWEIQPPPLAEETLETELFLYQGEEDLPPHPAVEEALQYYTGEGKTYFQEALYHLEPHYESIKQIFHQEGLPEEYLFLGVVESLFKVHAHSRAGARGPWQFMASTARLYGLTITPYVDERLHWEKATRAACRLLKDLLEEWKDEKLAFASYNAGKGKIRRAIRRCRTRNFWKLRRCLPRETRAFVPSVLAAIKIGKNPQEYGFTFQPSSTTPTRHIWIRTGQALKNLEVCLHLPPHTLQKLNPHFILGYTPPDGAAIKVPASITKVPLSCYNHHRVQKGETLSQLARRLGVSVKTLMRINNLSSRKIQKGQMLIVPLHPPWLFYRVKKGDSLWKISRRFGVSLKKLMWANGLSKRSILHPGQRLLVPRGPTTTYRVRKGDTLYSIARRFGTTPKKIMKINGLTSMIIHPGDTLLIQ